MSEIRVAIVGVGNCANSLVQGVEYYQEAGPGDSIPGLMNVQMGDYHIGDLRFVTAFDVDATKVGLDVSKAMWAGMNSPPVQYLDEEARDFVLDFITEGEAEENRIISYLAES